MRRRLGSICAASAPAVIVALVLSAGTSRAQTVTYVTSLADSGAGSLRADIAASSPGDTIAFSSTLHGTIDVGSPMTIPDDISIVGNGAVTLDGQDVNTIFSVNQTTGASISGLTLTHGRPAILGTGCAEPPCGTLALDHLTITDNAGVDSFGFINGGAIEVFGVLTISGSTFDANTAGSGQDLALGGAIDDSGSLAVRDSTFVDNAARGGSKAGDGGLGGAIEVFGVLTISGSTFEGNTASGSAGEGGAIDADGTLTVTNSTLFGNDASSTNDPGMGGAIDNNSHGFFYADTIDGNTAEGSTPGSVGGIYGRPGDFHGPIDDIRESIVAANTGDSTPENCDVPAASAEYDLSDTPSQCDFDLPAGDPRLGPLQDNGGPTLTQALEPGSPALQAVPPSACTGPGGAPLSTDQRGLPRPGADKTRCDVGAYESQGPSATISSPADGTTYTVGQSAVASFSCAAGEDGPALAAGPAGCTGSEPNGASIDTSAPGPHTFTVTATNLDDESDSVSTSYTVRPAPTSTSLACAPDQSSSPPLIVGQASSCTATVTTAAGGSPSGTVALTAPSGTISGSPCTLAGQTASGSGGSASCATSYTATATAPTQITASYSPADTTHAASDAMLMVSAAPRPTGISVSCSPDPISARLATTCTARVSDTGVGTVTPPTGTVSFSVSPTGVGSFSSATCALAGTSASSASCHVAFTPSAGGSSTIKASYGGDPTHRAPGALAVSTVEATGCGAGGAHCGR